jgi:hypothetical protein
MDGLGRQPSLHNSSAIRIVTLERKILIALCTSALIRTEWEKLARALSNHAWQEPEHQVVYEALRKIRSRDPRTWREQLPAQATRMGFPDVDWMIYLAPKGRGAGTTTPAQVSKMLHALKALGAERPD